MRKKLPVLVVLFSAAVFLAVGLAWAHGMPGGKVEVKLSPPPTVKSSAGGTATFETSKDGKAVHYKLDVDKIQDVTMAHVHQVAEGGKPGPVLTWLYPTTGMKPMLRAGKVEGTLAEGDITAESLAGPMKGKPVGELLTMLKDGKAGVAVHTKEHPGGELWAHRMGTMEHKGMMKEKGMKGY